MAKNPFSIYDFIGYLFPGILFLLLIVYFWPFSSSDSLGEFLNIKNFVSVCNEKLLGTSNSLSDSTVLTIITVIIISYILGHVLSYVSSMTVEYMSIKAFGYPSDYLFKNTVTTWKSLWTNFFPFSFKLKDLFKNFFPFLERITVWTALFPVTSFLFFLGVPSKMVAYLKRPVDNYVINNITSVLRCMTNRLKLPEINLNLDIDSHRIVMHYVYYKMPESHVKANNYIALYGFLRTMALVFCLLFDYLLFEMLCWIKFDKEKDGKLIFFIIALYFLCNILYMGFMKFYRRFTLENYMALLVTEKEDKDVQNGRILF